MYASHVNASIKARVKDFRTKQANEVDKLTVSDAYLKRQRQARNRLADKAMERGDDPLFP